MNWECDEDEKYIYLNNKPIAEKVALKSKMLYGSEIYVPEVDRSSETCNAVRILKDFNHKGVSVFRKGEIFNAPYCLYEARWNMTGFISRLMSLILPDSSGKLSVEEMERQITFSNQKLFEVQDALSESERRLKITEIYTRKSLVEKIREGADPTSETAQEREMAVMFSDIRDFTPLAESMSPKDIVRFLNSYFNRMNDVIHRNNGEIDKLIGDCIMAGFDNSADAVQAAIGMKEALAEYNRERYSYNLNLVRSGIGITFGQLVTGNIGSSTKMDYTMIGDPVNVSSRLEGLTKEYGLGLLISEEVKKSLSGDIAFRFVDYTQVKGREDPVSVYEIFEYEPDPVKEKKMQIQEKLSTAFRMYLAARFKDAASVYRELIAEVGPHTYLKGQCADPVLEIFFERCEALRTQTESGLFSVDNWDGVYRMN